ncbi:MAG: prepilin-type N-terminal cleavage/methylation domain-containing protein [Betaproteobacteria bacterium]
MQSRRHQQAFTLVELMVSLSIMAFLLMACTPFLAAWTYSRQIKDAQSKLLSGYGLAKALALRNPNAAQSNQAAAGLKLETGTTLRTVYVCQGDPGSANCASSGSSVLWSADFPSSVALTLGGTSVTASSTTTVGLNNRGLPTTGVVLAYTLARGVSANDATGSLL